MDGTMRAGGGFPRVIRRRIRSLGWLAGLLGALALAACNGSGADGNGADGNGMDGDAGARGAANGMADARPVVRIGRLICGGHLPLAVVEQRFQSDLPFHLQTVQNHDWNDVVADMAQGRLAGTFILSPLAMELIRKGLAAHIVLMADRNGNGFVLSKKFASIGALAGKDAIIAVPHRYSQHHVLLYLALKQHGLSLKDVTVVAMPPRDMINALRRGEIDGFVVGEPEGAKAVHLGAGWMAAISPRIWKDHMDHVFILADAFVRKHPDRARALVAALVRAGRFIEAHPREAARMGESYTGSDAAVFAQVLTTPPDWIDYSDMRPTPARLRAMAQRMVAAGLWPSVPRDLARYVDMSLLEGASDGVKQPHG